MTPRLVSALFLLTLGIISCTSSKPAPVASPTPVKAYVAKDEQGNDLPIPEIVRSKLVQNDNRGVKTVTVGNDKGDYVLSCNMEASNCVTPEPGRDYYVFTSTTKWKFPSATGYVTLAWLQDWSVTYKKGENIALLPAGGGKPEEMGMYFLDSWSAGVKRIN
jgi:hypothetical protein